MISSLRLTGTILLVLCALIVSATLIGCENTSDAPATDNTVRIGTLLGVSGDGSEFGVETKAAIDIAIQDLNQFLLTTNSNLVLEVDSTDTQGDPARALQLLDEMADRGIKIIIGPLTAAEAMATKDRAKERGVILLSPSTAISSLSIANDNFFSMIPATSMMGNANAAYLKSEGITHLIAVYVDDLWGADMVAMMRPQFTAGGGVIDQEIKYGFTNFDASAISAQISAAVASAVAAHGAEHVGVSLFSYTEGIDILKEAMKDASLDKVKWLGSAPLENEHRLQEDKPLVSFLQKIGFPCAFYGVDFAAQPIWGPLQDKLIQKIGHDGDSYAFVAYDALWLAAYTAMDAGSDDAETLRKVLLQNSQSYFGASGWTGMNDNGTRRDGNFDFWSIRAGLGGEGMWYRSHVYERQPDGQYILKNL